MLRVLVRAIAQARCAATIFPQRLPVTNQISQYHNLISSPQQKILTSNIPKIQVNLFKNPDVLQICQNIRPLTKFSLKKGKRKTVKCVLKRFYRLNWGAWIRTKSGRHKKMWKKSESRKRRLRQHVFTNSTQSWLLDKMVTKYWRKPKFYVDDPYEPYHSREEFYITRRKPL